MSSENDWHPEQRIERIMGDTNDIKKLYSEFRREPIRENCIVFESLWGRSYSCNPAALYEYIAENHPEYECVWFLNDVNTPVRGNAKKVERNSEEYYHYLATAKYFIYNANFPVSFKKREEQIIVQTMHGTPFKTFGLDVKEELPTEKEELRVVSRSIIWDYLVAQGEFTKNMAWRWFRFDNVVLETGYPRTDSIYSCDEETAVKLRKELGIPDGKKVILYAPTWRDMDRFDMMLDLEEMRGQLAGEYVILVRPHYFVADKYDIPEDGEFVFDGGRVGKIEDLFTITDILITDYSSVMFDFALTDKPMIFFAYDLEEYTEDTRGAYFDIATEAPGALAKTTDEVIESIRNIKRHYEINGERIDSFRSKYLTYENRDSAARVYKAVFEDDLRAHHKPLRRKMFSAVRHLVSENRYYRLRKKYVRRLLHSGK